MFCMFLVSGLIGSKFRAVFFLNDRFPLRLDCLFPQPDVSALETAQMERELLLDLTRQLAGFKAAVIGACPLEGGLRSDFISHLALDHQTPKIVFFLLKQGSKQQNIARTSSNALQPSRTTSTEVNRVFVASNAPTKEALDGTCVFLFYSERI